AEYCIFGPHKAINMVSPLPIAVLRFVFFSAMLCTISLTWAIPVAAQKSGGVGALQARLDKAAAQIEQKVIAWRRDFHQHPELGNREFRTSKIIAEHLRNLGMEVQTGVARTGVVG